MVESGRRGAGITIVPSAGASSGGFDVVDAEAFAGDRPEAAVGEGHVVGVIAVAVKRVE